MHRVRLFRFLAAAAVAVLLGGCEYAQRPSSDLKWDYTPRQRDSIVFARAHHYTENYNFKVTGDSLRLLPQSPADIIESMGDTAWVFSGDRVVVADIARVEGGGDEADSVWVKLARDQATIGWLPEGEMLRGVAPDDPISQFVHVFGNRRVVALCCLAVIAVAIALAKAVRRKRIRMVHFNDIGSAYPTLLCVDVAVMAVVYASVQHFVPQTWQEFYFHPTLNPFTVPPVLSLLLVLFWGFVLLAFAAVDDVARRLEFPEAVPYLLSLAGTMLVVYLVLAATTIIYIGYALLIAYIVFAFAALRRTRAYRYVCGRCGHRLRHKGTCPYCGAMNV